MSVTRWSGFQSRWKAQPKEWDNTQAMVEGWAIFDANGTYQIQRDDQAARFEDDVGVWKHIWTKSLEGSEYHAQALQFIAENSPDEWHYIVEAL